MEQEEQLKEKRLCHTDTRILWRGQCLKRQPLLSKHFMKRSNKIIEELTLTGHLLWTPAEKALCSPVLWNPFKTEASEVAEEGRVCPERGVMLGTIHHHVWVFNLDWADTEAHTLYPGTVSFK